MQSLSGHHFMRQEVPTVFSLHLVYFSTAACISEKKNEFGARIYKGLRLSKNHKMLLFVSWHNKYEIIEWPRFLMHQQVPIMFLLLLVHLSSVACISEEIIVGPCCARIF